MNQVVEYKNIITDELEVKIIDILINKKENNHNYNMIIKRKIKSLSEEEVKYLIEEILYDSLSEIKNYELCKTDINDIFKRVDNVMDYFYDKSIIDEIEDIEMLADDLIKKSLGINDRNIILPVDVAYLIEYGLPSTINIKIITNSLFWMILRIVCFNYISLKRL